MTLIPMMAAVAAACLIAVAAPVQAAPKPVPPLVRAETHFAFDVFAQLRHHPGNLFFSPYSLYSAIGMAYLGARANTAAQIASVLHLNRIDSGSVGPRLQSWFGHDFAQADMFGGQQPMDFHFHAANAVWTSAHDPIEPRYIAAVRQDFAGRVDRVDFGQPTDAAARINQWVKRATAGRLDHLIDPDTLSPRTRMILTNGVYFRARWSLEEIFDKNLTKPGPFHLAGSRSVMVPMMHQTFTLPIAQADGVKILRLDYDGPASMIIILPNHASALDRIEAGLSAAELDRWLKMQNEISSNSPSVVVTMPRFAAHSQFRLANVLKSLGMPAAFSPGANFTGIAADRNAPLVLDDVVQRAAITVDEKGTKAMAATGMEAVSASASNPYGPPPIIFNADHPFLYVIRADTTGAILFVGREDDPAAG